MENKKTNTTPIISQPKAGKNRGLFIAVGLFALIASASVTYFTLHTLYPREQKKPQAIQPVEVAPIKPKEEKTPAANSSNLLKTQQDEQRKTDTARLIAAINIYLTNNRGKLPTINDQAVLLRDPVMQQFTDPATNTAYTIVATPPKTGEMQYVPASKCTPSNEIATGSNRDFAIRVLLSNSSFYCVSSS